MAPLPAHVREAIAVGLQTVDLLPGVESAPDLHAKTYWPVETGVTVSPDGACRVFVWTPMPGVTPAMWDWWFAWHGSEAQGYKLRHPRAHMHSAWTKASMNANMGRLDQATANYDPQGRFHPWMGRIS